MWWKKPYFNRRDWILENLGVLELSAHEIVVLLLIDYMNTHQYPITPSELAARASFTPETVDETLHKLAARNILIIKDRKSVV